MEVVLFQITKVKYFLLKRQTKRKRHRILLCLFYNTIREFNILGNFK